MEKTRHQLKSYMLVGKVPDLEALRQDYFALRNHALSSRDIHLGNGNEIIDLTFIDPQALIFSETRFAGSSTERAVSNHLSLAQKVTKPTRLSVGCQRNPMADDRNHNDWKVWARGSYTQKFCQSLGDCAKVTFATLHARGWWPSHYDFSPDHTSKINIALITNPEALSLSWCKTTNQLEALNLEAGEIWWINPGKKHTAVNWGAESRTFLLVTFRTSRFFSGTFVS